MSTKLQSNSLSTGLAMFAMFFGAGNVVFPILLGAETQSTFPWAALGLMLTAVLIPFLGLATVTLYDGNYHEFFARIGRAPGFFLAVLILALIGPFGAMPRCVTLAYATLSVFFPSLPLFVFSLSACILTFLLAWQRSKLLDVLGYVLTPILLLILVALIGGGYLASSGIAASGVSKNTAFFTGITTGYQTMDLLGALFFSTAVIACLSREFREERPSVRELTAMTLKASCIGATLLGLVYVGIGWVAAANPDVLAGIPSGQMLGALSKEVLGPWAGLLGAIAVSLACLTTIIALAAVSAEFLQHELSQGKTSYTWGLVITMFLTLLTSTLEFEGIVATLAPILGVLYPAIIVLTFCNLAHKLYGFTLVKLPVAITLTISLVIALRGLMSTFLG